MAQHSQQLAAIGDLQLESGGTLKDCKIGYRLSGRLNMDKTNAIILLTWYGGTAAGVEGSGAWQVVDTTKYCLITIDALGDGVSSSPSNSVTQHGSKFPEFTIRDMVNSQYLLLTAKLGIAKAKAIMGISMGGIQTFQWAVSYPDFAENVITIVGSPQESSYDLMLHNTLRRTIEENKDFNNGNYQKNPTITTANMLFELFLTTPAQRVQTIPREDFNKWVKNSDNNTLDWNDRLSQLKAIINNDVCKPFNGSLITAAGRVKAKLLTFPSKQDMTVNPAAAIAFAKLIPGSGVFIIDSPYGHLAGGFGDAQVQEQVRKLLNN